jgi:hypothetical protein
VCVKGGKPPFNENPPVGAAATPPLRGLRR